MKKILFTAIVATMFVTSCNKAQEIIANPEDDAVSFSVYASRPATKGGSIDLDDLQTKGFGVFAFYTKQQTLSEFFTDNPSAEPNFMNNQQVTFNANGKWVYSPLKFWPNTAGEKISFFAYAPYESGKTWADTKTHFTVDSLAKNHVDFLLAKGQTDRTRIGYKDSIKFNFKHSLAKIGFDVTYITDTTAYDKENKKPIDPNTVVVIDSVILQPKHTGFYKEGDIDLVSSTGWTPVAGSYYKSFKLSAKENFKDTTSACKDHPFGQVVLDSLVQLNRDDSYLMILPQDFTTTDSLDIIVNYHVWTKDAAVTATDGYVKVPNNVSTNHKINFEQGKQYKFNIILSMTSVKITSTVDSWSAASPVDVYTPIIEPNTGE